MTSSESEADDVIMAADAAVEIYRRYDDDYIVRSMTLADAAVVQEWYLENMGLVSKYDLDIALSSIPATWKGFYIGEFRGRVVAAVVSVPWRTDLCYLSYYYVDVPYRGRGFGTRVKDQVAWEHLGARMLCLDAVVGGMLGTNEQRLGYTPVFKTGVFTITVTAKNTRTSSEHTNNSAAKVLQVDKVPFDSLVAYDNECFVSRDFAPRLRFLRQWIHIPGGETYVALDDVTGHVVGYGCRRPAMRAADHFIGPLYANEPEVAEALLYALCRDVAGDKVQMETWLENTKTSAVLTNFGFQCMFELQHMHVNGDPHEVKPQVYAITSLDVCGF